MWSFLALRDKERAGKVWAPETKLRSMQGDVDALSQKPQTPAREPQPQDTAIQYSAGPASQINPQEGP